MKSKAQLARYETIISFGRSNIRISSTTTGMENH